MSGSAGLSPSRNRKPEGSTLSGYARNSRKECAGLVAGQAVLTAENESAKEIAGLRAATLKVSSSRNFSGNPTTNRDFAGINITPLQGVGLKCKHATNNENVVLASCVFSIVFTSVRHDYRPVLKHSRGAARISIQTDKRICGSIQSTKLGKALRLCFGRR